jgi:predicted translin family RNA/ssDNA-binding protein
MSLAQVQDLLRSSSQPNVFLTVTPQRYLLGISDLTGELMRFATNALGAGVEGQRIVTTVLRALRDIAGGGY